MPRSTVGMPRRPTKAAIAAMAEQALADMATIRDALTTTAPNGNMIVREDLALTSMETFVAIALRVFAQTNTMKLIEVMRLVEIQARMDGKVVYE